MTKLDAIRARLAANPHASYPELVDPWPAYVAWLVETVDLAVKAIDWFHNAGCTQEGDGCSACAVDARLEELE